LDDELTPPTDSPHRQNQKNTGQHVKDEAVDYEERGQNVKQPTMLRLKVGVFGKVKVIEVDDL
jgi:hypothetical protein